jgi:hypothetical protein
MAAIGLNAHHREEERVRMHGQAIRTIAKAATTTSPKTANGPISFERRKWVSSPAVIQIATGPSKTTTKTNGLSQLLPALAFRRSAAKARSRGSRMLVATAAARFSASRIHAFGQFQRPAEANRHRAVTAALNTIWTKVFTVCVGVILIVHATCACSGNRLRTQGKLM